MGDGRINTDEQRVDKLQASLAALELQNKELRKTRFEIEASREKYLDLFEHAPMGYLLVNDHGLMVKVNQTLCSMLGEKRFMVIGKPFSQWISEGFEDHFSLFRRRLLQSNKTGSVDLKMCRPDGGEFFVRIQGVREEVGDTGTGLRLTVSDISDNRELQSLKEELQQTSRRLDCALSAAEGGFWQLDLPSNSIWLDTRAAGITGQGDAAIEKDYDRFLAIIHPDDREQVDAAIAAHFSAENDRFQEDFRVIFPNGGRRWLCVRGRVTRRDKDNRALTFKGIVFSIDRRKELERETAESHHRLHSIVDNLPACIAYVDRDLHYQFNNERYRDWLGIAPEDCRGKHISEIVGEQSFANSLPHYEIALQGKVVTFTSTLSAKNNERLTFRVSYLPDFDHDRVKGFFVLATDITELEQVRKKLEVSRQRYLSLYDYAPVGYLVVDRAGIIIAANLTFCTMLGLKRPNLIGLPMVSFVADGFEDDFSRHYQQCIENSTSGIVNLQLNRENDTVFWARLESSLEQEETGNRLVCRMICSDDSVRHEAQSLKQDLVESRHQLRQIVDHLPACVSYLDRDRRYRFNNQGYQDLLGIAPEECKGKHIREVIGEKGYRRCRSQVDTVLTGRQVSFENTVYGPDNVQRLLQVSYIPDFDHQDQVKGFFVLALDITDSQRIQKLKETMAELEDKGSALEEANIALKVLVDQQQNSREEVEQQVLVKLKKLVFPYLDLLQGQVDDARKEEYLTLIRAHLGSVADSFTRKLSNPLSNLTPREILVADLIRQGRSTKEMAGLLGLSVRTIEAYRMQLRKKLGLQKKNENLRKYLLNTFGRE